jgi:hypothetical protein
LVEEAAAAAGSMQEQAANLVKAVGVFSIDEEAHAVVSVASAGYQQSQRVRTLVTRPNAAPGRLIGNRGDNRGDNRVIRFNRRIQAAGQAR